MKKIFSILFLLCLQPVFLLAQTSAYKGFYQTRFFNVFGDVKVIEAEFEVRENNTVVGKLKIGNETRNLEGQVASKGKFEIRTLPDNGAVTIVKGELPVNGSPGKAALIERSEQKGNGSKSVSKSELSGFIKQLPPPVELKDVGITDNGKTQLWFQHPNPLFGKEWTDYPAVVVLKNSVGQAFEMEMKWKTADAERRFRFRLVVRVAGQKIWPGKEVAITSYAESKKSADGKSDINFFLASTDAILGGQIEIVSENESEMVFKITNLRFKRTGQEEPVQVDGYIHAVKSNNT